MYCGYDLKFLSEDCFDDYDFADSFHKKGLVRFTQHKKEIEKVLDNFALYDDVLNGSAIQENWFPQIEADIFISHSHSDDRTAIIFSEILRNYFGLTSFIDSCVWGYSTDLLELIDNRYCRNYGENSYDYAKRNLSTSHVHMMLSTALMMMIDNCECVFFLDTPNSVSTEDVIKRTQSPWIYSEINISRLIKRKLPQRKLQESMRKSIKSSVETFSMGIEYDLDMSHFIELTDDKFDEWYDRYNADGHPLDVLYNLVPPKIHGVKYG
jgi:hypothetical protein